VSLTVCLAANTIGYTHGGGHFWVYLNWALGLRALGCRLIWLEGAWPSAPGYDVHAIIAGLKSRLAPYGLAESLALFPWTGESRTWSAADRCLELEAAWTADLLLNMAYDIPAGVVQRFRRSALLDIDPGLAQVWMTTGKMRVPKHDAYFTIGETVGKPGSRFPDAGLVWHYTPPCVSLDSWVSYPPAPDASFTTVTHWQMDEWEEDDGEVYCNDKRIGFLPFLQLPRYTSLPLELALGLAADDEDERLALISHGWRVRDACEVAATPWDYQRYVQTSLGEFSCVKPSCIRRQNAWISDRTLCYLASGKPAVIQHTGPSRFLPDAAGLFRFRNLDEAIHSLEVVAADYDRQSKLARQLAEEYFESRRVAQSVLERALT
jgi:hypothetical protein